MKKEKHIWPKWSVQVRQSGEIIYERPGDFMRFAYPYIGKPMHLILKKKTKDKSRQEEKYYWAVVVQMVAEEMGIGREEAHKTMADLFLKVEDRDEKGRRYYRTLSTTELTDDAYRDYWGKCVRWASLPTEEDGLSESSGLGIFIPLPNEADYENAL